jgi:hypothetical protein
MIVRHDRLRHLAGRDPLAADDDRNLNPLGREPIERPLQFLPLGRPGRIRTNRLNRSLSWAKRATSWLN